VVPVDVVGGTPVGCGVALVGGTALGGGVVVVAGGTPVGGTVVDGTVDGGTVDGVTVVGSVAVGLLPGSDGLVRLLVPNAPVPVVDGTSIVVDGVGDGVGGDGLPVVDGVGVICATFTGRARSPRGIPNSKTAPSTAR
jgi:hypothetical protein